MKRKCSICSSNKKEILSNISEDIQNIVMCKNCGFTYADNLVDFNRLEYLNNKLIKYHLTYVNKIVNYIIRYTRENKNFKILGIGETLQEVLGFLKKKEYKNLTGLNDLFELYNELEQESPKDKPIKFDMIVMTSILENLWDTGKIIDKISSLLNLKGILFLEIPDVENFYKYKDIPFQQFRNGSVNYFSKISITNLLNSRGIKVINIRNGKREYDKIISPSLFVFGMKTEDIQSDIRKDNISKKAIELYTLKNNKLKSKVKKI